MALASSSPVRRKFIATAAMIYLLVPSPKISAEARTSTISRLHVSEGAAEAHLTKRVAPVYPKNADADGEVILTVIISRKGRVKDLYLVRGDPLLVKAAIRAVSQWEYQPFLVDGRPVEVETQVTVTFRTPPKRIASKLTPRS